MAWPKGVGKGPDKRPLRRKGPVGKAAPKKTLQEREMEAPQNLMEFVNLSFALDNQGYTIESMVLGADDSIVLHIRR